MGGKINQVQNSKILNFFPNQATDTVRLDESILGHARILASELLARPLGRYAKLPLRGELRFL